MENDDSKYTIGNKVVNKEANGEIIRIHVCATMWHESQQEMSMLLDSMLRLDLDINERKRRTTKIMGIGSQTQMTGSNDALISSKCYLDCELNSIQFFIMSN